MIKEVDQLEVEKELKALRYLINDMVLQMYDMRMKLEDIVPTKREYTHYIPNNNGDDVKFDMFSIPKAKYNSMVEQYGVDIMNLSCNRLDDYIRSESHIPYGNPVQALSKKFIKEVAIEKANEVKELKRSITIDKVKDKDTALAYISTIPTHLQELNEDVARLKEEYDIE